MKNLPRISRIAATVSVKSAAAGLLLLFLAAGCCCGKRERRVVAVVPKGQAQVFWRTVHAGAAAAGQEFGIQIRWNGPASEIDATQQINIVDDFINQRVAGIVLAPVNGESLVPVVERAAQEHIPVVIIDSGIRTEKYVSYVSTDNYRGGVLAAERLGKLIPAGELAIIGTTPGSVSGAERETGFRETVAARFPGLQVVDYQYGMSDRARALAAAGDILAGHPGLAGIFCSNESSTIAAVEAAKARGVAGKVKIVGFDAPAVLVEDLKAGYVDSLLLQDPFQMGYLGVKSVVDTLEGRVPPKHVETGVKVVTAANLQDPAIQRLMHPH